MSTLHGARAAPRRRKLRRRYAHGYTRFAVAAARAIVNATHVATLSVEPPQPGFDGLALALALPFALPLARHVRRVVFYQYWLFPPAKSREIRKKVSVVRSTRIANFAYNSKTNQKLISRMIRMMVDARAGAARGAGGTGET